MSENSNLNPLTNFLLKERVCGDGGVRAQVYTRFFMRNDKMAFSTRSFLIYTLFLVPKIS